MYTNYCVNCHGKQADGRGPDMRKHLSKMDFHSFMKRFSITLHKGAPSKWYAKISDGYTSDQVNEDGSKIVMPPFRETLAREQIWLAITYLQSLDADAESGEVE